jgi:hypothetical protein
MRHLSPGFTADVCSQGTEQPFGNDEIRFHQSPAPRGDGASDLPTILSRINASEITVDDLEIADPADAWTRAGFRVDLGDDHGPVCPLGGVRIRLTGRGRGTGIVGWSLRGLPPDSLDDLDGVPTARSAAAATTPAVHPNGVTAIDHLVLLSPDLGRTVESLAAVGVRPRRQRDAELGGRPIRQIFFRFGDVIVEAVGTPEGSGPGPSMLWGVTFVVADIDATAAFFGDRTSPVKDAVQPGRRITTLRHQALGLSVRTAMISASR